MLATIDSIKFNHKNKIGEFKYISIKDLINNIKNNTVSEIDAKKVLNTLSKIKIAEIIQYEKRTSTQKELLNLFNDLFETILTENKNENENENDNKIKNLNDSLDEMIDESQSFEDQIKLFKKAKYLNEYWHKNDYGDKELNFKIFKLKLANLSNIIDEKMFEQIFGHTFVALTNKLINTRNKEKNQIIVNNIKKDKGKLHEEDETDP